MIRAVKELLAELTADDRSPAEIPERDLHLISAALMAEVMVADGTAGKRELRVLGEILEREFGFDREDVDAFVELAREKAESATSLFEFTDVVNRRFDQQEKFRLIQHLWQVARADEVIHKFEEATIRKVAELIHLPHSAFIRAKQLSR